MSSGFECGDGWFELIRDLSAALEQIAHEEARLPDSEQWPEAFQVKEKFGRLRFYIRHGSPAMYRAIDEAQELSEQICMMCGAAAHPA